MENIKDVTGLLSDLDSFLKDSDTQRKQQKNDVEKLKVLKVFGDQVLGKLAADTKADAELIGSSTEISIALDKNHPSVACFIVIIGNPKEGILKKVTFKPDGFIEVVVPAYHSAGVKISTTEKGWPATLKKAVFGAITG